MFRCLRVWRASTTVQVVGLVGVIGMLAALLIAANVRSLDLAQRHAAWMQVNAEDRAGTFRLLWLARSAAGNGAEPVAAEAADQLEQARLVFSQRLQTLRRTLEHRAPTTSLYDNYAERSDHWTEAVWPLLARLHVAGEAPSGGELARLEAALQAHARLIDQGSTSIADSLASASARQARVQYLIGGTLLAMLGLVGFVATRIMRRIAALVHATGRVAEGDLTVTVPDRGHDDVARLASSLNSMTVRLRGVIEQEQDTHERLEQLLRTTATTAAQIVESTAQIEDGMTQHAQGAEQQRDAVSEAGRTVEAVSHTAREAAEQAQVVARSASDALGVARQGERTIDESAAAIDRLKQQCETIAERILGLADQAQAIDEIIETVTELADQASLLAINAAIEASRAGEPGKGFAVLANEIKALSEQGKASTVQVRQILVEVQRATQQAVMVVDEGTRSADSATKVTKRANETIHTLAKAVASAAEAGERISVCTHRQASGMNQINQAMQSIRQVMNQNLASTRRAERAARHLNALGERLRSTTEQRQQVTHG
ncbi:MAG: methyl-accepting chemotaxis protein [Phycisphaeraceae bacterium]